MAKMQNCIYLELILVTMKHRRDDPGDAKADDKVSGEDIANSIGLSRTAIWKAINALRKMGYEIDGDHKGYCLVERLTCFIPTNSRTCSRPSFMGRKVDHNMTIGSTTNEPES